MINDFFNWIMGKIPAFTFLENKYFAAITIILTTILIGYVVLQVFVKIFEKFAANTKTDLDDMVVATIKQPIFYLIIAGGLRLAFSYLGVASAINLLMDSAMALVVVFVFSRLVDILINVWGKVIVHKTSTKLDEVLLPLLHKFSKVVFVIIGFMWLLSIWGVDITPYLAGVGISGIVIGLALQDSLKNVFGGVSLILDGAVKVGDKIRIESGEIGEVTDVGLRSTKIKTYDNEELTIPNGYLASSRVQNYTRPTKSMRVWVSFGVEYGADTKKVKAILEKELSKMKDIMKEPAPVVQFQNMGNFALEFKALFWVENWQDAYPKKLEATELIYDTLNKKKIGIPFPTQTVYLKKMK